ncbi:MAG TPA: M48 family peptidase [Desulfobulbus sp.]|nr:M48 family peptidase [Desulfobulbus sp.]
MNPYLIFILCVLVFGYLLDLAISLLTLRSLQPVLPEEFSGIYDAGEYARSQEYTRVNLRFSLVQDTIMLPLTIAFILLGGFNLLDLWARSFGFSSIPTGLLFTGLLLLLSGLVHLPFSVYSTFVIENRFGLNRTTVKTFVFDILKTIVLVVLLGGPILALILWFFEQGGGLAWLYCWLLVVGFTIIMQFLAPVVIMPLFNRFTPLADGELKKAVTEYAHRQNFALQGIYTMDGSKRSNRLNAFFTGFGRFRRIVFFDTLMEKLTVDELVVILAHEMGHFKKKHILKMMVATILQTGLMFFILSLFIQNPGLFAAFGMEHISIYAGLVFFGFLYAPISTLLSVVGNVFSRKYEYQADRYAVGTTGKGPDLITGLKKLCRANLSNLTPHPLQVFLQYSHPPVLRRIEAIRATL